MKNLLYTLFLMVTIGTIAQAQQNIDPNAFPEHVEIIKVDVDGKSKALAGSLSEGRYVDLRFGMRSSVGCFTEDEKKYFNGHHKLYAFEVPANTKVLVELNSKANMSLYGYMITSSRYDVPPYLQNVSKSGCSSSRKPTGELDRIMLKATNEKTHVIIAVTGIEEADQGAFNLKITAKS